jgi:hypothetical protein
MMTGISLQQQGVFSEGDLVMRRPGPIVRPPIKGREHLYQETGLIVRVGPMQHMGIGTPQVTYETQSIDVMWGYGGKIEKRTTVFNDLLLVNPNTGQPENVFMSEE